MHGFSITKPNAQHAHIVTVDEILVEFDVKHSDQDQTI
jgi:hypothetical protein